MKMYIARIKIRLRENFKDNYYEKNKWFELFEHKGKQCKWRIKENGTIDIIIGNYYDRFEALNVGKKLYFNILYEIHRNNPIFYLGDSCYENRLYHEDRGYAKDEFIKNEEFFFNTKKESTNFLGIGVYEIENDMDEYDKYENTIVSNFTLVFNKPYLFLDKIKDFDEECVYSKKTQEIFNLIRISEETDKKTAVLLLCQVLEKMGENDKKTKEECDVIDGCIECVNKSNLIERNKESLINMLKQGKNISSKEKCRKVIEKYSKYEYNDFDKYKVFNEIYTIRGNIIHGGKVDDEKVYNNINKMKALVLDILKEWSKDN